jgi:hypothetical protein
MNTGRIGVLLVALWFLFYGLTSLFSLAFASENVVMGLLALVAGILLLVGR